MVELEAGKTNKPKTNDDATKPLRGLEAAPSSGPSLYNFSDGGLGVIFSFSLSAPRRDSDHLPHLRLAKEGQYRFCRSLVFEEQGHPGSFRVFPPAAFHNVFPELLDLGNVSQFTRGGGGTASRCSRTTKTYLTGSLCTLLHR